MMMANEPVDYVCIHEKRLGQAENRITELETRADYKDKRIDELNENIKDLKVVISSFDENLNNFLLKSVQDDNHIDKRVTSLESTVHVLKWITTLLFGSGIIWIFLSLINKVS
jgi:uncharacterized coiled-coil protein SlyX